MKGYMVAFAMALVCCAVQAVKVTNVGDVACETRPLRSEMMARRITLISSGETREIPVGDLGFYIYTADDASFGLEVNPPLDAFYAIYCTRGEVPRIFASGTRPLFAEGSYGPYDPNVN